MIENIDQLSYMNIDTLSNLCNTSTASITRFCQKLGYQSFKELKYSITKSYDTNRYHKERQDELSVNHAIIKTISKYDKMLSSTLSFIKVSDIDFLINKIVTSKRIAIFCASHDFSAAVRFQAHMKMYNKKVDVIICNTNSDKLDHIIKEIDYIIFLTYGGRWMRRSQELVKKILNTPVENCVLCINESYLKGMKFAKKIVFDFIDEKQDYHFVFFSILLSIITDAVDAYYLEE